MFLWICILQSIVKSREISTYSINLLWKHFLMSSAMTCKSLLFVFILEFQQNKWSKFDLISRVSLCCQESITYLYDLEVSASQDGKKITSLACLLQNGEPSYTGKILNHVSSFWCSAFSLLQLPETTSVVQCSETGWWHMQTFFFFLFKMF